MTKPLFGLILLALAACASAVDPSLESEVFEKKNNSTTFRERNVKITLSTQVLANEGTFELRKHGGTNTEFQAAYVASVLNDGSYTGQEPFWKAAKLDSVSLTIGSRSVPLPNATDIDGPSYSKAVRFATTEFPNGPLDIQLKVSLTLTRTITASNPETGEEIPVGTESRSFNFEHTTKIEVYNRIFTYMTYWDDGQKGTLENSADVRYRHESCLIARAKFGSAYYRLIGPNDPFEYQFNQSPDLFTQMTAGAFFTHGSSSLIEDSTQAGLPWSTILAKTSLKGQQGYPQNSIVALFSCSSLAPTSNAPEAFGAGAYSSNCAVLGFERDFKSNAVEIVTDGSGNITIKNLVSPADLWRFLSTKLAAGSPLDTALSETNRSYRVVGDFENTYLKVVAVGDLKTRIKKVYLTDSEWQNASDTQRQSWYYIF